MEETEEKICIQNTKEYREEVNSFIKSLYEERKRLAGTKKTKRTVLDRLPSNLIEEILLVLDNKSKQPSAVRKFLKWINAQVVIRVVSAYAPIDKLPADKKMDEDGE